MEQIKYVHVNSVWSTWTALLFVPYFLLDRGLIEKIDDGCGAATLRARAGRTRFDPCLMR